MEMLLWIIVFILGLPFALVVGCVALYFIFIVVYAIVLLLVGIAGKKNDDK